MRESDDRSSDEGPVRLDTVLSNLLGNHLSHGRTRYDRPSYAVGKDGRVVQVDAYGNRGKTQYQFKDGKVYETDAYGRVQQQKFIIKDEQRRSK